MPALPRKVTVDSLNVFAFALFRATGMDEDKARTVGRLLVLTDMMGRRTHGLAMARSGGDPQGDDGGDRRAQRS